MPLGTGIVDLLMRTETPHVVPRVLDPAAASDNESRPAGQDYWIGIQEPALNTELFRRAEARQRQLLAAQGDWITYTDDVEMATPTS